MNQSVEQKVVLMVEQPFDYKWRDPPIVTLLGIAKSEEEAQCMIHKQRLSMLCGLWAGEQPRLRWPERFDKRNGQILKRYRDSRQLVAEMFDTLDIAAAEPLLPRGRYRFHVLVVE